MPSRKCLQRNNFDWLCKLRGWNFSFSLLVWSNLMRYASRDFGRNYVRSSSPSDGKLTQPSSVSLPLHKSSQLEAIIISYQPISFDTSEASPQSLQIHRRHIFSEATWKNMPLHKNAPLHLRCWHRQSKNCRGGIRMGNFRVVILFFAPTWQITLIKLKFRFFHFLLLGHGIMFTALNVSCSNGGNSQSTFHQKRILPRSSAIVIFISTSNGLWYVRGCLLEQSPRSQLRKCCGDSCRIQSFRHIRR